MVDKLLLVEDDLDFGTSLAQYLNLSGFEVQWISDPAILLAEPEAYLKVDLAILDIMMPTMDGYQVAQELWKYRPQLPLLFLTAKNQKIDRLMGLKLGADDYIAKPCDPEELILRIQTILKRSQKIILPNVLTVGRYLFDRENLRLTFESEIFRLTEKEVRLLDYLLINNHSLVKRDEILTAVWGNTDFFAGRSMDVFISRLRKYLKHDSKLQILSIRGVGFQVDL